MPYTQSPDSTLKLVTRKGTTFIEFDSPLDGSTFYEATPTSRPQEKVRTNYKKKSSKRNVLIHDEVTKPFASNIMGRIKNITRDF